MWLSVVERWDHSLPKPWPARGSPSAVIDPDPMAFRRLRPQFPGKKIEGLGFDRATLIEAGAMRGGCPGNGHER